MRGPVLGHDERSNREALLQMLEIIKFGKLAGVETAAEEPPPAMVFYKTLPGQARKRLANGSRTKAKYARKFTNRQGLPLAMGAAAQLLPQA